MAAAATVAEGLLGLRADRHDFDELADADPLLDRLVAARGPAGYGLCDALQAGKRDGSP